MDNESIHKLQQEVIKKIKHLEEEFNYSLKPYYDKLAELEMLKAPEMINSHGDGIGFITDEKQP